MLSMEITQIFIVRKGSVRLVINDDTGTSFGSLIVARLITPLW